MLVGLPGYPLCLSKPILRDAAKAVAVLLAWIMCLELGLQLSGIPLEGSIIMPQWPRAFCLRPNAEQEQAAEGQSRVRINALGFDDIERQLERPRGTFRIAVIGDSYTQAPQVSRQEAFPAVIERSLRGCPQRQALDIEVLNFGVGGYGLAQQWMLLRDEIWAYDPQIVIEAVGLYNDIVNCDRHTSVSGYIYPYFVADHGRLLPDEITSRQRAPDPRWVTIQGHLRDIENRLKMPLLVEMFYHDKIAPSWQPGLKLDPYLIATFSPPHDPHMANAWAVAETALSLMNQECLSHGAEFWVITLDFNIQSYPDPAARDQRLRELAISDPHYPDRRIIEFARSHGMHNFWLSPLIAEYAESHRVALHGFYNTPINYGHYNVAGNRFVGEAIASELCRASQRLNEPVD